MSILNPGQVGHLDPKEIDQGGSAQQTDEQKRLRALIARRHPEYKEGLPHWEFMEATYEGGREWFAKNIFRYIKEGDTEFLNRVTRAYRFNHTREVVDLINKYLFKQSVTRNESDAPESVKKFWKSSTRSGLSIKDFMRQVSKKSSIYGRCGIVIDTTAPESNSVSLADAEKMGIVTYAYIVEPGKILDYSYDEQGQLRWVLIQETVRDDADPMSSSGKSEARYRLWTKTNWSLFREKTNSGVVTIETVGTGDHTLGVVPVILADHMIGDDLYEATAMIDDIAYLDRAAANYLSNLDAIIQDQTFSQLAMPAQNVIPGEDSYNKLVEMGTKRVFLYDGEGGAKPFYLSPDVKQAELIVTAVNKIIGEIYHTVGLAGERTKQDNAVGIDNSSGVAKAYDFERVNALLSAKADSLELIENKIVTLVALWNRDDSQENSPIVSYPDDFDTRGLYDEFDISARLMLIDAPALVRQEQMKSVLDKLFPQLGADIRARMEAQLLEWPVDPIELASQLAEANAGVITSKTTARAAPLNTPTAAGGAGEKPDSEKRQGQVTKGTS